MKVYVMGKLLEPDIRETTNKQTYIRFSVYGNHQSMQFDVYELQTTFNNGERRSVENPMFKQLVNLKEGTPVMASVRPVYNERFKEIRYYLESIHEVDESSRKAINAVLSSKNNKS